MHESWILKVSFINNMYMFCLKKLFYRTCILEKSLQHKALEEEDKNYLQHFSGQRQAEHLQGRQDPALVSKMYVLYMY